MGKEVQKEEERPSNTADPEQIKTMAHKLVDVKSLETNRGNNDSQTFSINLTSKEPELLNESKKLKVLETCKRLPKEPMKLLPSMGHKRAAMHKTGANSRCIKRSRGPEQVKGPKPELKRMNEADINAFKGQKAKRPAIIPTLKEVPHLSLALFVLISIGIVLAISHMASKFGEYSTKHDPNWIRGGNDSHQALPWALDQVLVRSIRNFKEPYFEATHQRLGYDVAFQYKAGKENQATDAIMTLGTRSNSKGPAMMEPIPSMKIHFYAHSFMEYMEGSMLIWHIKSALATWAFTKNMDLPRAQRSQPTKRNLLAINAQVNIGFLAILWTIRSWLLLLDQP